MNSSEYPSPPKASRWWLVVPLGLILLAGLLIWGVTGVFRLSRDARCLRNTFMQAKLPEPVNWNKKLELSLGAIPFYLLRSGLAYAPLEPEARTALQAVRGAEVGIYRRTSTASLNAFAVLEAADEAMAGRGWERLLGVSRGRELVVVYVPKGLRSSAPMQMCVAVLTGRELVVVSARSNLEPLIELALNRPEWKEQSWMPTRL